MKPAWLILTIAALLSACGEERTVTEYSVQKVDPRRNFGHEWLPLNPTTYRVGDNSVVSETAGILDKYEVCTVLSVSDWECRYSDDSGSFGFKNGEFWRRPDWDDIKSVSKLRHNLAECDWSFNDKYDGYFWGAVRCVSNWR